MLNGGARPGAGRKLKAEKFARPIATAEKRIADRLPFLIDQQFTLAEGVLVQDDSESPVYRRPPDRQAIEYLLNRIMGKPVERKEVTGQGGAPIEVEYVNDWRSWAIDDPTAEPARGAAGGADAGE